MIYKKIDELIGNTPLLEIPKEFHGIKNVNIYAKLEYMNPFGSLKDRIAKKMIGPVLSSKADTVLESSSGNTAKALATLSGMNNLNFKTITNRIKVLNIKKTLQILGAEIQETPHLSECPDPNDPDDPVKIAQKLADSDKKKYYYTNQYLNELNIEAHEETGLEILNDLQEVGYFFGFLGTCGSTLGAGRVIKSENKNLKIIGVVSEIGQHIPGGRAENELWETGFFKKEEYNEILKGTSYQAIHSMIELNRKLGMLCGPTTGLVYKKLIDYLKSKEITKKTNVVFIACDRLEPYIEYVEKYDPSIFGEEIGDRLTINNCPLDVVQNAHTLKASELIENLSDYKIIDIRANFLFQKDHIKGSINIPSEHLDNLIDNNKIFSEDDKIVFICKKGLVSKRYAAYSSLLGYESFSLEGGLEEYNNSKNKIESQS